MSNSQQNIDAHQNFGLLIARAAHDIRSPLAIMQIALDNIENLIPEENIQALRTSVQRIRTITNDLLIQRHIKKQNNESTINLSAILQDIINEKLYEWQDNRCHIQLDIQKETAYIFVKANCSDVHRILSNLLNNAYESLREKRTISISLQKEDTFLILTIKDTGCGIPADRINDVMQGTSLKLNGHGIGLSSAIHYMQSIDGHLKIHSIENIGTEIILEFLY